MNMNAFSFLRTFEMSQKSKANENLCNLQDLDSMLVFNGQFKGPSGAFVTHCNISCFPYKKANVCLSEKLSNVFRNRPISLQG